MTRLDPALEEDWIVCLGETRTVRDDSVACPRRDGAWIELRSCAECRLMAWQRNDRASRATCSTSPAPLLS